MLIFFGFTLPKSMAAHRKRESLNERTNCLKNYQEISSAKFDTIRVIQCIWAMLLTESFFLDFKTFLIWNHRYGWGKAFPLNNGESDISLRWAIRAQQQIPAHHSQTPGRMSLWLGSYRSHSRRSRWGTHSQLYWQKAWGPSADRATTLYWYRPSFNPGIATRISSGGHLPLSFFPQQFLTINNFWNAIWTTYKT